jgi:hypothetical protein
MKTKRLQDTNLPFWINPLLKSYISTQQYDREYKNNILKEKYRIIAFIRLRSLERLYVTDYESAFAFMEDAVLM